MRIIGLNNHYAHSKIDNGINWVKKLRLAPEEILMIGDTDHDFEAAQEMNIDCLLLSQGHHCPARLEKTGGRVFQSLNDICHFFHIDASSIN